MDVINAIYLLGVNAFGSKICHPAVWIGQITTCRMLTDHNRCHRCHQSNFKAAIQTGPKKKSGFGPLGLRGGHEMSGRFWVSRSAPNAADFFFSITREKKTVFIFIDRSGPQTAFFTYTSAN